MRPRMGAGRTGWAGFLTLALAVGCASQQGQTRSTGQTTAAERGEGVTGEGVPPEKVDEIQQILNRKSQDLDHCWREEAERTKNPKLAVDLMVKLTIMPGGTARDVSVVKDEGGSKAFEGCVVARVQQFEFPSIPQPLEMTWPYLLKPLY